MTINQNTTEVKLYGYLLCVDFSFLKWNRSMLLKSKLLGIEIFQTGAKKF